LLGGVCFYGDPFTRTGSWDSENEIGTTWNRFGAFLKENPVRPYSSAAGRYYEVHIYGEETNSKGFFEVFVGEEVTTFELPVFISAKYIGASEYLQVMLSGAEITSDWWQALDSEILPSYQVKRNDSYIIQAYDERFQSMDNLENSSMDVYLPVIRYAR
jgi:predicted transcriptional regulator YdeE